MQSFLRKNKLIDSLSLSLPSNKAKFIEKFKENVEPSDLSFTPFEALSNSPYIYKGNILENIFTIQKKKKLFAAKQTHPIATGKIIENINGITVTMEINGISPIMKFFYGFLIFFYSIFILAILSISFIDSLFSLIAFPFIIIHATLMFTIPFFMIKSSVKNFKLEIEREFYFWIK
ncbi:conserved hypothetical protein [Flavobacterium sp. 9AF]|uniref:hypothetical protein n=1 Tax=Flavobacterium sp. 9AF TaxID=2653142 RepID=UPI0012F00681|nr:hypothetical protein [Flavobacterium sp. 9AF]VXB64892.1 conserved hypothetical protein [Flavobacterium sp. 9AF]